MPLVTENNQTLQAAVLTPRGRGAVATIRVVGDCTLIDDCRPALFQAANQRALQDQIIGHTCFGHWGVTIREEVVVCRVDEATLEIHCHGGDAAVQRILDDLQTIGAAILRWQDQLRKSVGTLEAEWTTALTQASTTRTAELLSGQLPLFRAMLQEFENASWSPAARDAIRERIDAILHWSNFGLHLVHPWRIVLGGRPNVGKSSLINALVGYDRSIVFDEPGTTRDVVTAETAIQGWPVELADTAGIREEAERLESEGIGRARRQFEQADCRVVLLDTGQPPQSDDWHLLDQWPDAVVVGHKSDLANQWCDKLPVSVIPVSSLTGDGLEELTQALIDRLIPETPLPETVVPFTERQVGLLMTLRSLADRGDEEAFRQTICDFGA